ncbi:hypothetical protein AN641_09240 [Candidatus Epulonipiscioides gigas]|nr:hypothetical protein AN641_09240 [Epulopiscium sp. SCG-C07WGA-EpuloA2]
MDLIFNYLEIQNMLIDFYNLTGFRIALFDNNFQELLAYPNRLSSFCKLIRTNEELHNICKHSDYQSFCKCRKIGSMVNYQCHLGLTEIIIPIKLEHRIIGYLMTGQIYENNTKFDNWNMIYNYLKQYNLNLTQLENIYRDKEKLNTSKILSANNMINLMIYYLAQTDKIIVNENTLSYKIDKFILDNISNSIDVNMLCKKFNYQKTTFYKLTNEIYGISIMKHVAKLRIQMAKNLLSSTNLPISEVASLVGVDDYNYFSKIFKKEEQCTPREYRKNNISIQKI